VHERTLQRLTLEAVERETALTERVVDVDESGELPVVDD
jgi:hypothetical protein